MRSSLKTDKEIQILKEGGAILSRLLHLTAEQVRPDITTSSLNDFFVSQLQIFGKDLKPSFQGYRGFPAALCVAVNDEVVHGIPSSRILKNGDIVSLDAGLVYKGLYTDSAITLIVGSGSTKLQKLIEVTQGALMAGIDSVRDGVRTGDIGAAIEQFITRRGNYGILRDYTGHGVGYRVHEDPSFPNHGTPGTGELVTRGMVFCLEPMVVLGNEEVFVADDGWTVKTVDGSCAAHFEHTIAIDSQGEVIILTNI